MTDLPIDEYGQPFKRKLVELVPCQHALNGTFCDVPCKAYVRGDGYYEVTITNQRLSRAEWEATIDYRKGYTAAEAELGRQVGDIEDVDSAAICDAFVDAAVKGEDKT